MFTLKREQGYNFDLRARTDIPMWLIASAIQRRFGDMRLKGHTSYESSLGRSLLATVRGLLIAKGAGCVSQGGIVLIYYFPYRQTTNNDHTTAFFGLAPVAIWQS
ncbi:hypothetical protein OUZ56_023502 [Daphnia magna]|uniref:Uncharacterized protein n=1 Tax=Daphnia magna TaxID=35525 RepID=A0ABR0AZD8_9CRUS|nr:hypothetical protein OUZ56_023502 [Daphnia magna]